MKFYKCDMCGGILDDTVSSMKKGRYTGSRKIEWKNPGGSSQLLVIEKTLRVLNEDGGGPVKLDICRGCLVNFERP